VHEVSLADAMFDQADRALGDHLAREVRLIQVHLGESAGVDAELFRTAFEGLRHQRGYTAADLEVRAVAPEWRCTGCGATRGGDSAVGCERCGAAMKLVRGHELVLARLELEVPDV
jgi:Zn finger protein HypA/HybF involved in hydrogenase expression